MRLLLDGRNLELDLDVFRNEDAAGLERSVEVDAEVLAVDLGLCLEAQTEVAEWVLSGSDLFNLEVDRLGGALDGEVTGDGAVAVLINVDVGGGEGKLWVLLHVEEVFVLYVAITVFVAGGDGVSLDGGLCGGCLLYTSDAADE